MHGKNSIHFLTIFNIQCSSNDNHHTVPYPSELNYSVLHDGMCLQWDVEAGYVITENLCPLVNISLLPPTLKIWQPDFYEFDILILYICTCNLYQKAFFFIVVAYFIWYNFLRGHLVSFQMAKFSFL